MLTEERYSRILELVEVNKIVKLTELCELLNASVSTIRRDLNALDDMGKLVKVHGGAIAIDDNVSVVERNVEEKSQLNINEKKRIAEYAASLIKDGDFVFVDAGTTTERIADYVTAKNVIFVTTGYINAKRLSQKGYKVYLPGGEIKPSTEAIVGASCIREIQKYNFTKCFIGTNGITVANGYTTPDINEAEVKRTVLQHSKDKYILSDHSKLGRISLVSFADINQADLIIDGHVSNSYKEKTNVKEVN